MRQTVIIILMVLVFGFQAELSSGQQKGQNEGTKTNPAFNSVTVYTGEYEPNLLFFKNSEKDTNWKRIPNLDRLYKVTCADALAHLKQEGKWQGHLKTDGSCGSTAEPAYWIMGNRLNYDDLQEQGSR